MLDSNECQFNDAFLYILSIFSDLLLSNDRLVLFKENDNNMAQTEYDFPVTDVAKQ